MMLTFFMFFAFAVNVGMLVNAKINLQNAADAAAFAGAAVQARQLTTMSYINYEMRRQYKKFLYRYYVVGGMSYASMPFKPAGLSPTTPRKWSPNELPPYTGKTSDNQPSSDFGVPTICFSLTSGNNPCQIAQIPGSTAGNELAAFAADPINSALIGQLQAIEAIRQNNCSNISKSNFQLGFMWLYNTDPRLQFAATTGADADRVKAIATLVSGMGLIPSEFLLSLRMKTLEAYLNEPMKEGITQTQVSAYSQTEQVAVHERTIQAFLSAKNSLGEHTFDNEEEIVMDEILPATLFKFKDDLGNDDAITTKFDIFVSQFARAPYSIGSPASAMNFTAGADNSCSLKTLENAFGTTFPAALCMQCNYPISVKAGVPVAFVKDQDIQTYYAVRLEAPAKVLFNPFGGTIKLRAYAAAKPFGSRIGPSSVTGNSFSSPMNPARLIGKEICDELKVKDPSKTCVGRLPNLPLWDGEPINDPKLGWNHVLAHFGLIWTITQNPSIPNGYLGIVDSNAFERGYKSGMTANPPEMAMYNIPALDVPTTLASTDVGLPSGIINNKFNFQDAYTWFSTANGEISLWAPLAKSRSDLDEGKLKKLIDAAFDANKGGSTSGTDFMSDDMKKNLAKSLIAYVAKLDQGQGENHEGFNVLTINEPFNTPELPAASPPSPSKKIDVPLQARPILLADPNLADGQNQLRIKTAFVPNKEQINPADNTSKATSVYGLGRNTYSVKFVTLNSLSGTGGSTLKNPLPNTKGLDEELGHIKH